MMKNSSLTLLAVAIAAFAFFGLVSATVASEVSRAGGDCEGRIECEASSASSKGLFATVMDFQSRDHYDEPGRF